MVSRGLIVGLWSLTLLGGCATVRGDYREIGRDLNGLSPNELAAQSLKGMAH